MQNTGNINRIKAVLAEQNKTSKWLAEQMGKDQTTILSGVRIPISKFRNIGQNSRMLEC